MVGRGDPGTRASQSSTGGGGETAVRVAGVTKLYRRYGRRHTVGTLKSAFLSGAARRAFSPDSAVPALVDVSFEVEAGETLGIVGPNGSGKSTLLKLLAGIVRPTDGQVEVRGRLAALLELGAGFHPEITGRENIEINGLLLGLTKRQIAERFDKIVRFAELEDFLDAPLKTYSSGMAVRLGFSIAAHSDPDVLLVDEVLAVGDERFAHRCLEKFAEFERARKTLLVVSHDLQLVAERCRRAIWLEHGRLMADGPSAETVARYRARVAEEEAGQRLESSKSQITNHRSQIETASSPGRIGSGVATVSAVRLIDAAGRPAGAIRAGEPIRLEMEIESAAQIFDFVFGFAIATVSGAAVFGSNTDIDGFSPSELSGRARVALEFPAASLAPGVYSVDAAVHARDGAPYDYRRDVLRFEVTGPRAVAGVWDPPRKWSFDGTVRWKS
jgi:ABC-type polysaccharide/polyol phosphate transport system ATPase subunit